MPIWIGAALLTGGCSGGGNMVLGPNPQSSVSPISSPSAARGLVAPTADAPTPHALAAVRSWSEPSSVPTPLPAAATTTALAAQPLSLLILDPTAVSAAATAAPKVKLPGALRQNGQRRVLALLNIGAIAKTNSLWQTAWVDAQGKPTAAAPAWLEPANIQNPDVYPVQFWNSDWQKQVNKDLDALVTAGYDGVCLEGVGEYRRFVKTRPTAGPDMAAFVEGLAARARKKNPAFSLVTDGGAELPAALTGAQDQEYFGAVDGVLARNVFYPGGKAANNPLAPNTETLAALSVFQKAGKAVFVTEELTDPTKIADFLTRAKSLGFIPDSSLAAPPDPSTPTAVAAPQVADAR